MWYFECLCFSSRQKYERSSFLYSLEVYRRLFFLSSGTLWNGKNDTCLIFNQKELNKYLEFFLIFHTQWWKQTSVSGLVPWVSLRLASATSLRREVLPGRVGPHGYVGGVGRRHVAVGSLEAQAFGSEGPGCKSQLCHSLCMPRVT